MQYAWVGFYICAKEGQAVQGIGPRAGDDVLHLRFA